MNIEENLRLYQGIVLKGFSKKIAFLTGINITIQVDVSHLLHVLVALTYPKFKWLAK